MRPRAASTIVALALLLASSGIFIQPVLANEVPNTIAFRKVSETRYNLSINLLDQYGKQEVGIRIRRITGSTSEIITLPSKVLGAEGRGALVINQKLQPDDVFLFTQQNLVIYKVAFRNTTVIDVSNPEVPVPIVFESSTVSIEDSLTAVIDHPNDAVIRALSGKRFLLTINLIDRYTGQEIVIEQVRKISGKQVRTEIGRKVLGAFGKTSIVLSTPLKKGDQIVMTQFGLDLFGVTVKSSIL